MTLALFSLLLLGGCGGSGASAAEDAALTVTALDVGKADAFVLRSAAQVTVIDTGTDKGGKALVAFLEAQGIEVVDVLIVTHFDKDHVGGADRLIDQVPVGRVYTTRQSKDSDDVDEFYEAMERWGLTGETVTEALSYEADGVRYEIWPPMHGHYQKKESNNSSLVVRASVGAHAMLFAGDAEEERIAELLTLPDIRCDVLKVPHHGRLAENTGALIARTAPDYAVITSSDKEPEDEAVLALLADAGAEILLTREGAVTFTLTGAGVTVSR